MVVCGLIGPRSRNSEGALFSSQVRRKHGGRGLRRRKARADADYKKKHASGLLPCCGGRYPAGRARRIHVEVFLASRSQGRCPEVNVHEAVDAVLRIMARNRHRYPKQWEKVRLDRVEKLMPRGVHVQGFLNALRTDGRIKLVKKQADGVLVDAVQLHYKVFTKM